MNTTIINKSTSSRKNKKNHGHASVLSKPSSTYNSWTCMKQRCHNKNYPEYHYYGGRGIFVCERWRNSFINFLIDMGESPGKSYSIDRIDNNKGYYKLNCRWADKKTQALNRRKKSKLDKDKKTGKDIFCKTCKKQFYVQKHRLNNAKYCSIKCHAGPDKKYNPLTGKILKCLTCKNDMYVQRYLIKTKKYCSKKCQYSNAT